MVNKRFLEMAERQKNSELPKDRPVQEVESIKAPVSVGDFPERVESSFLLEYDNFGKELIAKSNERFKGTKAEISLGRKGEVQNMYMLKRLALVTTIANDSQLRKGNVWPITPLQSEVLLKEGSLPKLKKYWEDLALVLYDTSSEGMNSKEAGALYESLVRHSRDLNLQGTDLDSRLLVVNAGLEVDSGMQYGVKPAVLPGITQVHQLGVLNKEGGIYKFEYGLNKGLPNLDELGSGSRSIYLPGEGSVGLRVLFRYRNLNLVARSRYLASEDSDGRVNFAPQGRTSR